MTNLSHLVTILMRSVRLSSYCLKLFVVFRESRKQRNEGEENG